MVKYNFNNILFNFLFNNIILYNFMKENEFNDSYNDNINSNLIIYESEKHKNSLNFMEQRNIKDIFDSLEIIRMILI